MDLPSGCDIHRTPGYRGLFAYCQMVDFAVRWSKQHNHRIADDEVYQVLRTAGEDRPAAEGARMAIGKTDGGRYLRIVYVPDPEPDRIFVITGYDLSGKALTAYRRRLRKKGEK